MSASAGRVLILLKGPWSSAVSYDKLDAVSYNGSFFIAKRQNTNVTPTDGADWMLCAQGASGLGVTSFNSRVGVVVPMKGDYDISMISPTTGATSGQIPILMEDPQTHDLYFTMQDIPSSGHTYQGPAGTDMQQRSKMQFLDTHITDDQANDKTKAELVKRVTAAQLPSQTEDGFYQTTDEGDELINASDIAYKDTSVGEALDKTFILTNQTLVFSGLVATISDTRITADTLVTAYFTDACRQAAIDAGIEVSTSSQAITFTAKSAPSTTLVCDVVCGNRYGVVHNNVNATEVAYSGSSSGLQASTAQGAIDEIVAGKHGIFELWANPNALQDVNFAAQTIEVESDVEYDGFFFIHGRAGESIGQYVQYVDAAAGSTALLYTGFGMYQSNYFTAYNYSRNVTFSYNATTHKYSFTFSDGQQLQQAANSTNVTSITQNKHTAVERILGLIHNN